jgi:hypothetical protein
MHRTTVPAMTEEVKLFDTEKNTFKADSVGTITFYNGKAPVEYLSNKVKAIVDCNPWLEGRAIVRGKDLYLSYPIKPVHKSFVVVHRPNLKHDMMSSREIGVEMEEFRIKKGECMINSDENLFRIVLVIISDNLFGVYMSISHGIADGTTRYRLYGMLDKDVTPVPLVVQRVIDFEANVERSHGGEFRWIISMGLILNYMFTAIFGGKPELITRHVNTDYVNQLKEPFNQTESFISSNDILCYKLADICETDFLVVAVNHRGRKHFEHCTVDQAGNYIGIIILQKEDLKSPYDIRRSIADMCREKSGPLPGFWPSTRGRVTFVSNWSKIYRNVSFEGCEQRLHMPVNDLRDFMLPSVIVVFTPKLGELAVMIIHRNLPAVLSNPEINRLTKI